MTEKEILSIKNAIYIAKKGKERKYYSDEYYDEIIDILEEALTLDFQAQTLNEFNPIISSDTQSELFLRKVNDPVDLLYEYGIFESSKKYFRKYYSRLPEAIEYIKEEIYKRYPELVSKKNSKNI